LRVQLGALLIPILQSLDVCGTQERREIVRGRQRLFIEVALKFLVRNDGDAPAYKWSVLLVPRPGGESFESGMAYRGERWPQEAVDRTLLPGLALSHDKHLYQLSISPDVTTVEDVVKRLDEIIKDDTFIEYRAVSKEWGFGEVFRSRFKDLDLRALAAQIMTCRITSPDTPTERA
jgi:hypothetical protein